MPDDQEMQPGAAAPWRPSARLEAMWQRDVIKPLDDFQDHRAAAAPEVVLTGAKW